MLSFVGFIIGSYFLTRLIYKDEYSKHENASFIIGVLCTFVYMTIHNAVKLTNPEEEAIQAGLLVSIGLMAVIFLILYLINKSKIKLDLSQKEDVMNTTSQDDVNSPILDEKVNRQPLYSPHYKYKWLVPLVLAIILLVAWAFRWHEIASKTYNDGVVTWTEDRWTGTVWLDAYIISSEQGAESITRAIKGSAKNAYTATTIWRWAIVLDGAWLAWAIWEERKKAAIPTDNEINEDHNITC